MLSQKEIKKAANKLLKGATGLKVYGKEVTEGFERPSLFIEIIPKPFHRKSKNFAKSGFCLKITYLQEVPEELQQLELVDTVKEAFGMVFSVAERNLTVGEITYDYIGQKEDILQISVDFEFYENTMTEEEGETAEEMNFNLAKKEEEDYESEGTGN